MNAKEVNKPIRLLVVEDQPVVRIGLRAMLSKYADIELMAEANDGALGVKMYEELKPDIVLMDLQMPNLGGIAAAREILATDPAAKIIMFTSYADEADLCSSMTAGASGYCLKDVEPERLHLALSVVAAGDIWLDSNIARRLLTFMNSATQEEQSFMPPEAKPVEADLEIRKSISGSHMPQKLKADPLSVREKEVLGLLVEGLSNHEIAHKLCITTETVRSHLRHIMDKIGANDRTQAAILAIRDGLL